MSSNFMEIAGDDEEIFLLRIGRVLEITLFRLASSGKGRNISSHNVSHYLLTFAPAHF